MDSKPDCKYGEKCYQKNELHLKKFNHPKKKQNGENDGEPSSKRIKVNEFPCKLDGKNAENQDTDEKLNIEPAAENFKQIDTKNLNKYDLFSKDLDEKYLNYHKLIKDKFLVEMPKDFYKFWEFCESLNKNHPDKALIDAQLLLVGPFDVLNKKFDRVNLKDEEYLQHWRFFFDSPELQTIIYKTDKSGYHLGYYRDAPNVLPDIVVSNTNKDIKYNIEGGNLFAAVHNYLKTFLKTCNPFQKIKINKLQSSLEKFSIDNKFNLDQTKSIKERNSKVVAKTLNSVGIVVKLDKKKQIGYRSLVEDNKTILKYLENLKNAENDAELKNSLLSKIQNVILWANVAADEYDFGTPLELGIDLLNYNGDLFDNTILLMFTTAYTMLDRLEFLEILKAHMKNRRKGCDLSMIKI